ncbi:MAG: hypothetical protein ACRBN8_33975 [Nannocystales bacterium]
MDDAGDDGVGEGVDATLEKLLAADDGLDTGSFLEKFAAPP